MIDVFSTSFLGAVDWYAAFIQSAKPVIDIGEHYVKQTHRNRCLILSSNGDLPLIIPVKKSGARAVKDIEISYSEDWQTKAIRSIRSAYQNSPYFEHYQDEFESYLTYKDDLLYRYNLKLQDWVLRELGITIDYSISDVYITTGIQGDYRKGVSQIQGKRTYKQVFAHKFGFTPGLSIIDLLFNKGPESLMFLK